MLVFIIAVAFIAFTIIVVNRIEKKRKPVYPEKILEIRTVLKPLPPPMKKEYKPRSMHDFEKWHYNVKPNLQFWYWKLGESGMKLNYKKFKLSFYEDRGVQS